MKDAADSFSRSSTWKLKSPTIKGFPGEVIISSKYPENSLRNTLSTLYHNFLFDYCRDFSHMLHVCTRPQVDSLCEYRAWVFLNFFYDFLK